MPLTVDGEPIPEAAIQYELDRLVRFYAEHISAEEIRDQLDALRERARDQAIGAKLLLAEADRLDLRVPADDVDERIEAMIERMGGRDAFENALRKQKLTVAEVREGIDRGCKVDLLVERVTGDVKEPGEDEIKAHFDAHTDEYVRPDRALAQHILIKPASDAEGDRETARARVIELRSQIEEGSDFAGMAAMHSHCPSGKEAGGSLGWFSRGMMLPEFDEAVFGMDDDELSDAVESPVGFHVIRKLAAEEGGPARFDDARERIREFLRHVRRGEAVSAYVNELREKAVIKDED